jgi:DNA-binding GntR family transcriptional regulator
LKAERSGGTGTRTAAICERIRAAILTGKLQPGERVRLEEVKAEFDVSWSPVREAVSRLVAEGLMVADEQRGYRIAPVSKTDLAEVIRLRVTLETMAFRESIAKGDDVWEAEVLAAHHRLSKLEKSPSTATDPEPWEQVHRLFHEALIRASGATMLLQFCRQLHDLNDRYRRLFFSSHDFDRDVAGEHRDIVEATLARDADQACQLLATHIERTGSNILQSMQD